MPIDPADERNLMTVEQVAEELRVKPHYVYALARRGDIPAVRLSERKLRFRPSTIRRWIEEHER